MATKNKAGTASRAAWWRGQDPPKHTERNAARAMTMTERKRAEKRKAREVRDEKGMLVL